MGKKNLSFGSRLRRIYKSSAFLPLPPYYFRSEANWCFNLMLGERFPLVQDVLKLSNPPSPTSGMGLFWQSGYKR